MRYSQGSEQVGEGRLQSETADGLPCTRGVCRLRRALRARPHRPCQSSPAASCVRSLRARVRAGRAGCNANMLAGWTKTMPFPSHPSLPSPRSLAEMSIKSDLLCSAVILVGLTSVLPRLTYGGPEASGQAGGRAAGRAACAAGREPLTGS